MGNNEGAFYIKKKKELDKMELRDVWCLKDNRWSLYVESVMTDLNKDVSKCEYFGHM